MPFGFQVTRSIPSPLNPNSTRPPPQSAPETMLRPVRSCMNSAKSTCSDSPSSSAPIKNFDIGHAPFYT